MSDSSSLHAGIRDASGPMHGSTSLLSAAVESKRIDFSKLELDSFLAHPLMKREGAVWAANGGWTTAAYEPGATWEDAGVTVKCLKGHEKTCKAQWYLSHPFPSIFGCKFCDARPGEIVDGFLAFQRLDYVVFYPRPGIDNACVMGRVSQVNKKSLGVMTADGKQWSVKDLKAIKKAEEDPSEEISVAKRKRTEEDKLK